MFRKFTIALLLMLSAWDVHAGDIAQFVTNAEAGSPPECASAPNGQSPSGPSAPQADPYRGNPINVATGNKFHKEAIYQGVGEFPLEYSLYYNSRHIRPDGIGGRWGASYSQYVYYDQKKLQENGTVRISAFREDGAVVQFESGQVTFPSSPNYQGFTLGTGRSVYGDGRVAIAGLAVGNYLKVGDYINLIDFKVRIDGFIPATPDLSGPHEVLSISTDYIQIRPLIKPWPNMTNKTVRTDHANASIMTALMGSAESLSPQFKITGRLKYSVNRFGSGTTTDPYVLFFRDYKYLRPDGYIENFDHKGRLKSIESSTGLKHTITRTVRQYNSEFQPYYGPYLCWKIAAEFGTGPGVITITYPGCTEYSSINYLNWQCRNWSAKGVNGIITSYNCSVFAHKDAACQTTGSGVGATTSCEEIIEGEDGVRFDMDVAVADSYGNQLSWTEVGSRAHSVGGVCDGCASNINTPAGQFIFGKSPEGLISEITNPGSDNGKKQFLYEVDDSDFAGGCSIYWKCKTALTGILDEEGKRFATWEYLNYTQSKTDQDPTPNVHMGRAYKSYHGTGNEIEDLYQIEYTDGHNRKVTNGQGHSQVLNFTSSDGYVKFESATGTGGTNCKNTSASYSYNTKKQIEKIAYEKDANGNAKFTYDYTYYPDGRIETITEAKGDANLERKALYVWDANVTRGLKSIRLYEKTKEIQLVEFFYWPNGRLKEKSVTDRTTLTSPYATNGRKLTTTYTYDYWSGSKVKTLTIDGPRTDVVDKTIVNYDDKGRLTKVQNALGHITEFKDFTAAGLPKTIIDQNGVNTQLTYNFRNQVQTIYFHNALYNVIYYKNGLLKEIILGEGESTNFEYTSARSLKAAYDELGNRMDIKRQKVVPDTTLHSITTTIKNSLGVERYAEKIQLDALGRVYQWFGESDFNYVDQFEYDTVGNLIGVNNGGVYRTTAAIDKLGRVESITNSDTGVVAVKYDALDNVTSVKDPRLLPTVYTTDGFGRVIQQSSPDTGTSIYYYDAAGNVTKKTDHSGKQTEYKYDILNRLTDILFTGAQGHNIFYRYDATANGNYGKGRLTSAGVANGRGNYSFYYDPKGTLQRKTLTIGSRNYTWNYSFDNSGGLSTLQYPSNRLLTYSRNPMGRLTQVISTYAGVDEAIAQTIEYEPFGPLKSFYYGNGIKHSVVYNKAYWPDTIEDTAIRKDKLYYWNSGLLRLTDSLVGSSEDVNYNYDTGARLNYVEAANWRTEYEYDRTGNRDKKISISSGSSATMDTVVQPQSNRIRNLVGQENWEWEYTPTGQLSKKPASNEIYVYGDNGRLKNYQSPLFSAEYEYGPFGERLIKKSGGAEIHYAYEGPNLLAEFDATTGKTLREYFYADGELISMYEFSDKDADLMDDGWEKAAFGDLSHGISTDSDGDGLTDSQEYQAGLDPSNPNEDSDGDGMPDDWERYYFGTLSRNGSGDFDSDGTTDLAEYQRKSKPNFNDVAWLIPILHMLLH